MKAAERAVTECVQVRQLTGSGQWIANSGSDSTVAYEVEVTGNVAHGCGCLAGLNDDPVCKHRAAFYLLIGALDLPRSRTRRLSGPPRSSASAVVVRGPAARSAEAWGLHLSQLRRPRWWPLEPNEYRPVLPFQAAPERAGRLPALAEIASARNIYGQCPLEGAPHAAMHHLLSGQQHGARGRVFA
jgi:hypothetical protein